MKKIKEARFVVANTGSLQMMSDPTVQATRCDMTFDGQFLHVHRRDKKITAIVPVSNVAYMVADDALTASVVEPVTDAPKATRKAK